jgi:hypothetical protein
VSELLGSCGRAAVKAGRRAARYAHHGRQGSKKQSTGTQQVDLMMPPLGFGSTDERVEREEGAVEGRKLRARADRGDHVLSDGSNKRRKPD